MYPRKLHITLIKHLPKRQITVITGMRRTGKTTALKHVLSTIAHNNKIYIDLEKIEWRTVFNQPSYDDIKTTLELEGISFDSTCVIGLDEIQLVPSITSLIKFYYDTYGIKFIVTGSSSFYIKNRFMESLAGRKRIFEMYPLDFEEYLHFTTGKEVDLSKYKDQNISTPVHKKYADAYNKYITYGGFPEVVLAETEEDKDAYLSDIINSYISLDIILLSDFNASHDLYRLLHLLSSRIGSKVDVSKLSSHLGLDRRKVTEYIELLDHTYFVHLLRPFTRSKDVEISKARKVYFADTGLIRALNKTCPSGAVFENMVHNQLLKSGHSLQYWQKKTGQEIDFIVNESVAIEVKETPISSDLKKLERRANSIDIANHKIIGRHISPSIKDYQWAGNI